jgi:hypothetical protein
MAHHVHHQILNHNGLMDSRTGQAMTAVKEVLWLQRRANASGLVSTSVAPTQSQVMNMLVYMRHQKQERGLNLVAILQATIKQSNIAPAILYPGEANNSIINTWQAGQPFLIIMAAPN